MMQVESSFEHLSEESLAIISGGLIVEVGHSGQTGSNSSAQCDGTVVCCLPPPPPPAKEKAESYV